MVKFDMDTLRKAGTALAITIVGLGLVGQAGLIAGLIKTIIGWVIVVAGVLAVIDSFK